VLQNDLYYLADWGLTFTDALNETKGELAQEGRKIAYNEVGKEIFYLKVRS